jgi:4-diphosphocytidyl-2-C-methyl-D-erythritol kinase
MSGLTIFAPAKINLHLRVKGKRPDGYHELESIFAALDYGDTLKFTFSGQDGDLEISTKWKIKGAGGFFPQEKNLVYRAVSLFREQSAYKKGLRVLVEKRIPLGGGLGGGSSDAASTLTAMNVLSGANLSASVLTEMALKLGSDVPFFLSGGAALVNGRGEKIQRLVSPGGLPAESFYNLAIVLVNPGFSSGTAEAFSRLDSQRGEKIPSAESFSADTVYDILQGSPRFWPFANDFLPVLEAYGTYSRILSQLRDLGAEFSSLSGSGATCFGVFTDGEMAKKALKLLSKQWNFVQLTFSLAYCAKAVVK